MPGGSVKVVCRHVGDVCLQTERVDAPDLCVAVYDVLVKVVLAVEGVGGDEDVVTLLFGVVVFASYVSMEVVAFVVGVTFEVHLVRVAGIEEDRYGISVGTVADGRVAVGREVDAVAVVDEGRVGVAHLSAVEDERLAVAIENLAGIFGVVLPVAEPLLELFRAHIGVEFRRQVGRLAVGCGQDLAGRFRDVVRAWHIVFNVL